MLLGVITGLLAALFQSLSYMATRQFVQPRVAAGGGEGASRRLLTLAHVWMGAASVLLLPVLWPAGGMPRWTVYADALVLTAVFYLLGQVGLMIALRYAEPSRISPMLAFKIVILAGMASVFPATAGAGPGGLTALQWVAAGLCVVGGVSLNYSGGATHPRAALGVVMACVCYALSDWNIKRLVDAISRNAPELPGWQTAALATFLCYALCGVIAAAFLGRYGSRARKDWVDAAPFGGAWLVAMLFLFACFGLVGVVLGNILQSTRGLMSVVLGALLAKLGHWHIEQRASRGVFARRLAAAVLMVAAVGLYMYEKDRVGRQAAGAQVNAERGRAPGPSSSGASTLEAGQK